MQNFSQEYIDRSSLEQNEKEKIKKALPKLNEFRNINLQFWQDKEQSSQLSGIDSISNILQEIEISFGYFVFFY